MFFDLYHPYLYDISLNCFISLSIHAPRPYIIMTVYGMSMIRTSHRFLWVKVDSTIPWDSYAIAKPALVEATTIY